MKDKFYITTSIAYTNSSPHIGYCLELLQADVLARYNRLLGKDVWFLTGTDEHGSKIANKAKELGKEPQEFCDEVSRKFQEIKPLLNLSNDDFIRTTDKARHWPAVQKIWLKLKENGDICKKKYKGFYCVGCEAFLTEKDLVNGLCPIHNKPPEVVEEENYFFKLSKYQNALKKIFEENKINIVPERRKNEMLNFIKEGLEDVSCSREKSKLSWGVPAPDDNEQIIYVWMEALCNYLSALDYVNNSKKFKAFWPADVHCIGKDIQRFHLLLWPAMLISLGLELPKAVLIHGFITVGGQKMSKSLGNVIDPFELIEKYAQKIGSKEAVVDAVRYFLLREISPTEDGDFTYERFEERYNSGLANGLGNLLNRTLTLVEKYWKRVIPKIDIDKTGLDALIHFGDPGGKIILREHVEENYKDLNFHISEQFAFYFALMEIFGTISSCNLFIEKNKIYKPSEILRGNEDKINIALYNVLETIRHIALMLLPFMPETSQRIFKQLGANDYGAEILKGRLTFEQVAQWGGLKPGTKIRKGKPLFPKIS